MPCTLSPPLAFFSQTILSSSSPAVPHHVLYAASCHFSLGKKEDVSGGRRNRNNGESFRCTYFSQLWWLGITSVPGWHKHMQSTNERSSAILQWSRSVLMLASNVNCYVSFLGVFFPSPRCRRPKNDARFVQLNTAVRFLCRSPYVTVWVISVHGDVRECWARRVPGLGQNTNR